MPFTLAIQADHNPENVATGRQEWDDEVILGRGEAAGFRLPDRRKVISSRHAKIARQGNDYVLVDIGSTNGTFLNGTRIQVGTPYPLSARDQIGIGGYVLEFDLVEATTWAGEEDSDATLCVMPAKESSATIVERLQKRYAQFLGRPEEEREEELLKLLREAVSGLNKDQADEVLSKVEQEFSGEEAIAAPLPSKREATPLDQEGRAGDFHEEPIQRRGAEKSEVPPLPGGREEQVLSLLLDFMVDSIKGRRQFEKELEVEVTRIFGKERNPIKWAESSKDIRAYLFESPESKSQFPQMSKELQQVLEDLALHPVGLMAGFRECVRFLLKQLDPLTLEIEAKQKKKVGGARLFALGGLGSQSTWEYFKEKHRQLREEEIKTFHRLLGPEFAKGYLRVYQQTKSS